MGYRASQFLTVVCAVITVMSTLESTSSGPQTLSALHCPPCERIHCSPRRVLRLQCKGGFTTGVCGCCPACARQAGESCGGTWDYLGKCDEGLVCVYQEPAESKPEAEHKGICKPGISILFSSIQYLSQVNRCLFTKCRCSSSSNNKNLV